MHRQPSLASAEQKRALAVAVRAARAAGQLIRQNRRAAKRVNSQSQHDIKLELDVRCQTLIERQLRSSFPASAVLGEEGVAGAAGAAWRWVVDPIDGTVNFSYGIPHTSVAIALQLRSTPIPGGESTRPDPVPDSAYSTVVGVVYDPFCDELWTATRGQPARVNGRVIHASRRTRLAESIISLGFGKRSDLFNSMLPAFSHLVHRARKIRIMGSAALALVYVASGRFDAFLESGVRLWDIAAGGLILECAGGEFWRRQMPGEHYYEVRANNGRLRRRLERFLPRAKSSGNSSGRRL